MVNWMMKYFTEYSSGKGRKGCQTCCVIGNKCNDERKYGYQGNVVAQLEEQSEQLDNMTKERVTKTRKVGNRSQKVQERRM